MAKRNDFTDDEFGAKLCRAYDSVSALHENGDRDPDAVHPREILNSWQREAREAREAAAGATVQDNPPPTPGTPKPPVAGQDGRYTIGLDGVPKFECAGGLTLTGDAAVLAHSAAVDPRKVRAMRSAIKGY